MHHEKIFFSLFANPVSNSASEQVCFATVQQNNKILLEDLNFLSNQLSDRLAYKSTLASKEDVLSFKLELNRNEFIQVVLLDSFNKLDQISLFYRGRNFSTLFFIFHRNFMENLFFATSSQCCCKTGSFVISICNENSAI